MVEITSMELSGWGRYPRAQSSVQIPEKVSEIDLRVSRQLIARGMGRSYGNAAMLDNGVVVLTERLNRSISFCESTGLLTAEAGLTLADVLEVCVPRGWFPSVVPGTRWVSLGGCVAADIHGKNHHRVGAFGNYVKELELLIANGVKMRCSPANNPDLFWATVGGMGLTGIITQVVVQLFPIESPWIIAQHHQAKDLDMSLEMLDSPLWDDAYTVAWFDCLARGKSLGRSILIRGHHATNEELPSELRPRKVGSSRPPLSLKFDSPRWLLNSLTVGAFNSAFYRWQGTRTEPFLCHPYRFFFPLDRIKDWNRLYGKRGFVQYQCVLPPTTARASLQLLLQETHQSGRASFLAVLKRFGPQGQGLLSFPMEGYTLTMDFPVNNPELFSFLDRLDEIVVKHGGRVYLAKDARMRAEMFRAMYPGFVEWSLAKKKIDPQNRFDSDLARRLEMTN
jgi:decaprenylphospho-beta-D-ribofuranose 2-oxidase